MDLPDGGYRNRALIGAYRKGYQAGLRWRQETARNPYQDLRSAKQGTWGHVTFSRAFRKAWDGGFAHGQVDSKANPEVHHDQDRTGEDRLGQ